MIVVALATAQVACNPSPPPLHEATFLSQNYQIDRIYRSMMGPEARQLVRLGDGPTPELLWITGYRSEIVSPETGETLSPEFMCHSNLTIGQLVAHHVLFKMQRPIQTRLFTLSQGQMAVRFPDGFGIPVVSTELFTLDTQVLNLNEQPSSFEVQHQTIIEFVRESDVKTPMKPLFQQSAQGMVIVSGDDPYYGVDEPDPDVHGPGCMVGTTAGMRTIRDQFGTEFAPHWVVPPGRQVNRTLVTKWLQLPFDTRIHHIAVHVHPFSESVELRDLTADKTVFKSGSVRAEGRIGLEVVDAYSSPDGIPVYRDHEYELISIYDNTSGEPQDAMAVMFLYMHDDQFEKPDLTSLLQKGRRPHRALGYRPPAPEAMEPKTARLVR